ncbi:toll-like receptor 5 [Sceloporus undulatus]|uniref:toll-like receptor 5 n=1 Tax=Sceloporus undulatus TaxID=8520 RepID=UPI001C4B70B9|nr:toll-like receptor 5 [Sceloporus undulatus]XP_042296808.1 toll-like receptor 5 [Sceloporus undulatus]XP_042296816.1 toll-like receptor 5 [Sceloporus undulatus]XP_042296826.1 toll-like receptor 5 [Sceloporus undulatus]XP_042296835.1 toll-like receptor 5 [Sceloporus undulatus]
MLHYLLMFLIGMRNACREILAIPSCSVEGKIAYYDHCNLTQVPPVPEDIVFFSLNYNSIQEVNATSFPLLKELVYLLLGTQFIFPVTIRREAFRNLPNLQQLDLGGNKMTVLDTGAFLGLFNLNKLLLYYNELNESILEEDYFQDLISLEYLDLQFNKIARLHPHPLFYNMKSLNILMLQLNQIRTICEGDLDSFQGKAFKLFSVTSNRLYKDSSVNWTACGNPFKNIIIETLDVGSNGWNVATTQQFCTAVQGTRIVALKLSHHTMGSSFGYANLRNPDSDTFVGLAKSSLQLLDLSHGYIFPLNSYVFQHLGDLGVLDLNSNKINQIGKGAFYGLRSLQLLNLSYNLLGELLDYTFEGLHNVISIDLQNNHIGVFGENPFKHVPKLQEVNLRDNALKIIPSFPNPLSVFLGGNNRLQSNDVNQVNSIFLDLEGNRLDNLGYLYKLLQIPVLQYILLKNNRFSYCYKYNDVAENNQLIYLDLGENMLQIIWERRACLDVFKKLSKLQVLHLNNNYLSFLPEGIFSGLVSLNKLNLASNLLTYISHNTFPKSLRTLQLSSNQLLYPDPQIFAALDHLDITYNRFFCDCLLSNLIGWLNETNVTLAGSPNDMFCFGPRDLAGVPLHELNVDVCNEDKILESLQLSLFISTCVVLTVFLAAVIVFTRFRGTCFVWYKTFTRTLMKERQTDLGKKKYKYDAYVCYSNKDFEWVQNAVIKHLDSQYSEKNRFSLCFEDRDFLPGEDHISNIRDAIWNCRKTICVVTKQFLKDGWCVEAFNFAQSRYFCDLKEVLIMVVAGSLSQYQLMKYQPIRAFLQRGQYLRWPEEEQDVEWFLNALSHQILKEKRIKTKPSTLELKVVTTS